MEQVAENCFVPFSECLQKLKLKRVEWSTIVPIVGEKWCKVLVCDPGSLKPKWPLGLVKGNRTIRRYQEWIVV